MKIGIQTWGTEGDIRTLASLGAGLRARGHEVTLVATSVDDRDFSAMAQAAGIGYRHVPDRIGADFPAIVRKVNGRNNYSVIFKHLFFPFDEAMFRASVELCRESDVVVGMFASYPLKAAAALARKPHVSVTFWPGYVPTSHAPPPGEPDRGRAANVAAWKAVTAKVDRQLRAHIAEFWWRVGLKPIRHVIPDAWFSDELNLLAASPQLWAAQPDWEGRHKLVGCLHDDKVEAYELPEGLRRFLDAGPPPAFMTTGAAPAVDQARATRWLAEAARIAGCRAIVQRGPGHAATPDTQEGDVYFAGSAPHAQLFPRCAAVVHHGGAGTAHTASRCGKPSVVVGFSTEHVSWGEALQRAGIGSPPLAILRDLERFEEIVPAAELATAVRHVLDPVVRARAERVGREMQHEDGVAEAARAIEAVAAGRRRERRAPTERASLDALSV